MKSILIAFGIILAVHSQSLAQTITGTITEGSSGDILPGVNIAVKGTTIGTTTNSNGEYKLKVPSLQDTLRASFIGFKAKDIAIQGRTQIDITLHSEVIEGKEMVVVGYGSVEERDLTGSVSSIGEERLQIAPIASLKEGLQGSISGVQVKNTSGAKPGGEKSIRIRGYNSINSGNQPLYVIDGFPGVGDLSTINPSNIKSIEILKDASATAIYGARGANGVVLITTKKGHEGKATINLDYSFGVQNVSKSYDLLNATEFAQMNNAIFKADGNPPVFENPEEFGKGTDWQDEIFRTAYVQDLQLSVRGGNPKTTYALSGGLFSQEGVVLGSGLERSSFRANIESDLSKKLTVSASLYIAEAENDNDNPGAITAALLASPILPVKDNNGRYLTNADLAAEYGVPYYSKGNPVAMAKDIENITDKTHLIGNAYLNYDITDRLVFKTSFGSDINYGEYNYYVPDGTPNAGNVNNGGTAEISTSKYLSWVNENTLTYDQDFENQSINFVAGATFQQMNSNSVTARAEDFTDDFYKYNNLGLGNVQHPSQSSTDSWFLNSYFFRANYELFEKYLATITTRVDGSSKFGKNNKYGFFPSGALAWRLTEEPFLQDLDFLNNLKVRVSYGLTGNQEIGSYQSKARIGGDQYIFGGSRAVGSAPVSIANNDLKWEKTAQFDAGIDADFFEGRLTLTTDYYHKTTSDLLLQMKVPYTSGFSTSLQNVGKVSNSGFEFALNSINVQRSDWSWETGLNISFNKNKVLDLGESDEIISNGYLWYFGSYSIAREGYPVGMFYNYEFDGIWQSQEELDNSAHRPNAKPGWQKFVDQNNDGQIDQNDRTMVGSPHPDFIFGFNSSISWKNFNLNVLINGSYGNDVMNAAYIDVYAPNAAGNTSKEAWGNRWTPKNNSNTYIGAGLNDMDPSSSSMRLEDGSYLRIRNISLAYNLPRTLLDRLNAAGLKLYLSIQNLYTFTSYSGYNPEANLFGADNLKLGYDYSFYPQARTFNVGINIEF